MTEHLLRPYQPRVLDTMLAVFVGAVVFWAYAKTLGYDFTATDTFTLIATSRSASFGDVLALFGRPLMAGTEFVKDAAFYRPISTVSFALDYAIWGLNPFGYHLTDVSLHVANSVLVYLLLSAVTSRNALVSVMGSLLFGLHPIMVEIVPAIARRQDMISSAFSLASLLGFARIANSSGSPRQTDWIAAVCFSALALGSKETAIVTPVLGSAYVLLSELGRATGRWSARQWVEALFRSAWKPALGIGIYFALRLVALNGVGGYSAPRGIGQGIPADAVNIARAYFVDAFLPVSAEGMPPLWARDLIWIAAVALFASTVAAAIRASLTISHESAREPSHAQVARGMAFLAAGTLSSLALFVAVNTFSHRDMYFPVVFISGFVIWVLVQLIDHLALRRNGIAVGFRDLGRVLAILLLGAITIGWLTLSPLLAEYSSWGKCSVLSRRMLEAIGDVADGLPPDARLVIVGRPSQLDSQGNLLDGTRRCSLMQSYSLQSWRGLISPGSRQQIRFEGEQTLMMVPSVFSLHVEPTLPSGERVYTLVPTYP